MLFNLMQKVNCYDLVTKAMPLESHILDVLSLDLQILDLYVLLELTIFMKSTGRFRLCCEFCDNSPSHLYDENQG